MQYVAPSHESDADGVLKMEPIGDSLFVVFVDAGDQKMRFAGAFASKELAAKVADNAPGKTEIKEYRAEKPTAAAVPKAEAEAEEEPKKEPEAKTVEPNVPDEAVKKAAEKAEAKTVDGKATEKGKSDAPANPAKGAKK